MPDSQSLRSVGSIDASISIIRSVRDKAINELLIDAGFDEFLETHFSVFVISKVKREFICRDLTSLRNSSLDLAHYAELIKLVKANPDERVEGNGLLLKELFAIFERYGLEK